MAVTPNLNLYKPSREDYISVTRDISENMDKIDTGYGNLQNSISSVDDTIGIVVNGNTSSKNITAGQFVIVKNSTISGVTDGLYIAVNNVASETALVAADLSSSNTGDGGLNALNDGLNALSSDISTLDGKIDALFVRETSSPSFSSGVATVNAKPGYRLIACNSCRNDANYPIDSITEKTNGDYYIKSSSGVTANISIAKYWVKI